MANVNITNVKPPKAPNLPIAPSNYSQEYNNLLTNALRLYFNQLDKVFQYTVNPDIGQFYAFPFIEASDSTSQYATGNNTPTIVKWNTSSLNNEFTLNVGNTATALVAGIYKITYSLQFANDDNVVMLRQCYEN